MQVYAEIAFVSDNSIVYVYITQFRTRCRYFVGILTKLPLYLSTYNIFLFNFQFNVNLVSILINQNIYSFCFLKQITHLLFWKKIQKLLNDIYSALTMRFEIRDNASASLSNFSPFSQV